MTFRAIDPAAAKIYYAEEADRPITTLNIPDGSLVIFTDSGLEESFDSVSDMWFNRDQITQSSDGKTAGRALIAKGDTVSLGTAIGAVGAQAEVSSGGVSGTYQATMGVAGTPTATVDIEVSNDGVTWIVMGGISLSGVSDTDGFASTAAWKYTRSNVTALGAGADVTITMGG